MEFLCNNLAAERAVHKLSCHLYSRSFDIILYFIYILWAHIHFRYKKRFLIEAKYICIHVSE